MLAFTAGQMSRKQSVGMLHKAPMQIAQKHKLARLPACCSTSLPQGGPPAASEHAPW